MVWRSCPLEKVPLRARACARHDGCHARNHIERAGSTDAVAVARALEGLGSDSTPMGARAVHHAHHQRLLQLMVGGAHRCRVPGTHGRAVGAQTFERTRHRHRVGVACAFDGRRQHLQHQVHTRMHVVVLRLRKALAEGGVESV